MTTQIAATEAISGSIVFTLVDATNNIWSISGGTYVNRAGGRVHTNLSGVVENLTSTLTRLRVQVQSSVNFANGNVNVVYEK